MPRIVRLWSSHLCRPKGALGSLLVALMISLGPPVKASEVEAARTAARAVFQVLAAELALQAGEVTLAAGAYLGLARQSDDAGVAERATQLALAVRSPRDALEAAEIWLRNAPKDPSAQQSVDLLQLLLEEDARLIRSLRARAAPSSSAAERAQFEEEISQLVLRGPRADQGIRILDAVYDRTEMPSNVLYTKAMLQERRGLVKEMEALLRSLLARDPSHAHAMNALGYSLADRRESLQEAYGLVRKAHTLMPQDPHIMDSLGWTYFRLNQPEQAIQWLQEAYRRLPDAEIAAHLGEVLWSRGQQEEARRVWAEAHQRSPLNRVLLETLQRLEPEPAAPRR